MMLNGINIKKTTKVQPEEDKLSVSYLSRPKPLFGFDGSNKTKNLKAAGTHLV